MSVMFVTHSLADGGTDRVAVHLANGFALTCPTTLIVARSIDRSGALAQMIATAVQLVSFGRTMPDRTLDLLSALPGLIAEVRRRRPDKIVATGNNNSLFAYVGHLFNPNPAGRFFVKITNPIIREGDGWFKSAFRRTLYRGVLGRCARILVLSEGEQAIVAGLYPHFQSRIRVVQNPYVTERMLSAPSRRTASADGTRFLAIGRLHAQKNFALLLDAWAAADIEGATLAIAGEGPQREMLERKAAELGISGSLSFLGFRSDIENLLASSAALVLSSDYEGLPAVVLEAFAASCPVISTDCFPAAHELIGEAEGCVVVPRRDPVALAEALRKVAESKQLTVPSLREKALPYSNDGAVRSHMDALETPPTGV